MTSPSPSTLNTDPHDLARLVVSAGVEIHLQPLSEELIMVWTSRIATQCSPARWREALRLAVLDVLPVTPEEGESAHLLAQPGRPPRAVQEGPTTPAAPRARRAAGGR